MLLNTSAWQKEFIVGGNYKKKLHLDEERTAGE